MPDRVIAYSVNIAGSIAGIALFAAASWLELSPIWWFLVIVSGLGFFLAPGARVRGTMLAVASAVVLLIASSTSGEYTSERRPGSEHLWSPYYRIDYDQASRLITVNLIGHQQMVSRAAAFPAYALPHLLNRDVGRPAVRGSPHHRRRLGKRCQPGPAVGRTACGRRRNRPGDLSPRARPSSRSAVSGPACHRAPRRWPQLSAIDAASSTT